MAISIFDLFRVGIGPSSSHTVGPMRAARMFAVALQHAELLDRVHRIRVELYGSLGATGKGHGSEAALLLGLEGQDPESVDPEVMPRRARAIRENKSLRLLDLHAMAFNPLKDIAFLRGKALPFHSNGMIFKAFDAQDNVLRESTYYSVGGGFVVNNDRTEQANAIVPDLTPLPHSLHSGAELLSCSKATGKPIWQLVLENECVWRTEEEIRAGIMKIWGVMQDCVRRGCEKTGILPGGLQVVRRAPGLFNELKNRNSEAAYDPLTVLDWVNLYAIAVNEENAAGGRVVTAPTNGASGIIPAVLHYYTRLTPKATDEGVIRFFLTAGAIGMLYKEHASISGAEVGCQGEVGVACSMAAGGLVAAFEGTDLQTENAAEIGMEHNLGLTCDPIGGLVQIPCIERNAMGSVKAINAARIAMAGTGEHHVSLDKVIETMRQTGADMKTKYKETSRGGLAINIVEC